MFVNSTHVTAPAVGGGGDGCFSSGLCTVSFSVPEIAEVLSGLNVSKGAGPDKIPPFFIVNCSHTLSVPLMVIYNKSLREGTFPSIWKLAHVTPS